MNPAVIELARLLLEFEIRQQRKERATRALAEQSTDQAQPNQPTQQKKQVVNMEGSLSN